MKKTSLSVSLISCSLVSFPLLSCPTKGGGIYWGQGALGPRSEDHPAKINCYFVNLWGKFVIIPVYYDCFHLVLTCSSTENSWSIYYEAGVSWAYREGKTPCLPSRSLYPLLIFKP